MPFFFFCKGKYCKKLAFPEGRGSDYKNIFNDGGGDFLEQEIGKDQVKMNLKEVYLQFHNPSG